MKKSELNQRIHLSEGNIKSKTTEKVFFITWSLPSKVTCPYSTSECRKRCFAQKNETFASVRNSRHQNLDESKKDTFIDDMINHFNYYLQSKKTQDKQIVVRIHTSGDFYDTEYLNKWVTITEYFKGNKNIMFQAYTKSVQILEQYINNHKLLYDESFNSIDILNDINIHFVYSIWHDTNPEDIKLAESLNLQTFTALPKNEIPIAEEKGAFLCKGDCGHCLQCYKNLSNQIIIPYH